jgi:hypothetical protein
MKIGVAAAQKGLIAGLLAAPVGLLAVSAWPREAWLNRSVALLVVLLFVSWLGFAAWAFVHCARNPRLARKEKNSWLLAIALTGPGAAWFYAARHAAGTL